MNTEDSENKREVVFRSIRFEKSLAIELGDYVHEKKKHTKTSVDAEVQAAVRAFLGSLPRQQDKEPTDSQIAVTLLDAYKHGDKQMRQQLGEVLSVWKVKSKKAESEVSEDERETRIPKKAAGRRV